MNFDFLKNIPIPVDYNVSLAFIVLLTLFFTVYMAVRCFRRLTVLSVLVFAIDLFMLTTGVLTVIDKVISVPAYEIILIVTGILLPGSILLCDYIRMKSRIKASNSNVPLIEKIQKQKETDWKLDEYIGEPEEWKYEIKPAVITGNLEVAEKRLKSNITRKFSEVDKFIGDGEYKKALESYTVLADILSSNPFVYYNTAWLCYKNEQYSDSIKYCKKALHLLGDDLPIRSRKKKTEEEAETLISAVYFIYGLSLFALKKYVLAINQFVSAKKQMDVLSEAEVNIAKCYIALGEISEAQKHIRLALKSREDSQLRYLLARLCYENGEESESRNQLEIVVANDPDFTEAWKMFGQICRKQGDWQNAAVAYKKLTELTPGDADAYYMLGIAQRHEGRTEEAIASLKYAVELMPEHSRAYYSLASIYDAKGKTEKAIEYLAMSLTGKERLEMAYNLLAEIYISTDKLPDAIKVYEEAAAEHPGSYVVHFNLGVTLLMIKRYEEAVKAFKKACKITNDDPALYYNWASAVIPLKNYSEAARLYKEGLKLKGDDDEILFGLARVSALSGETEATIGFLARAIEINPDIRLKAKTCLDFAAYRTHPDFMEITRLPLREERKNA